MLDREQKISVLRSAVKCLQDANLLQQRALGADTDVSVENTQRIEELIRDFNEDIADLIIEKDRLGSV